MDEKISWFDNDLVGGLDSILSGGLDNGELCIIMGGISPGVGKSSFNLYTELIRKYDINVTLTSNGFDVKEERTFKLKRKVYGNKLERII